MAYSNKPTWDQVQVVLASCAFYLLEHQCLLLLQQGLELGRRQDLLHLLRSDHLWTHHCHGHRYLRTTQWTQTHVNIFSTRQEKKVMRINPWAKGCVKTYIFFYKKYPEHDVWCSCIFLIFIKRVGLNTTVGQFWPTGLMFDKTVLNKFSLQNNNKKKLFFCHNRQRQTVRYAIQFNTEPYLFS